MTFEMAQEALTLFADALPPGIYDGLNGGIILLPDTKQHPESIDGSLYILGEYHHEPYGLGRYITVYYGSFMRTFGGATLEIQHEKLREVLYHELTHHLEHLAGDRSLDKQDEADLQDYRDRFAGF